MSARPLAAAVEALLLQVIRRRGPEPSPLTPTQRLALAVVVDEGPLRLGALAVRMETTDPTATRTVDALEAAGLVARVPDEEDRRGVLIGATAEGKRFLGRLRRKLASTLERGLAGMPEEDQERLLELLLQLNELLGADVRVR